jgi:outer membrane protein
MRRSLRILVAAGCVACSVVTKTAGAPLLTCEEAVRQAIENNYLVKMVLNKAHLAETGNTPGNAGMLPKVSAGAGVGYTLADQEQKNASGAVSKYSGNQGTNLSASATVSWTLFDGFKMFAARSRLKRLAQIGELNYRDTLQTISAQTIIAYYDLVTSQQQMRGIQKAIAVSEDRAKIAEKQFSVGTVSKVDYLQAKIDRNEQKSAALAQTNIIAQKKAVLNQLLCRQADQDFATIDSVPIAGDPVIMDAVSLEKNSYQLNVAAKNVEVAQFLKQETTAALFPALSTSGGYGFGRSENSAGGSLLNQSGGWNAGVTLSVPLFNGFVTLGQVRMADLNLANSRIALDNALLQVQTRQYLAKKDFYKSRDMLALEEENMGLADENLAIALERFRLGQSTSLELRTAELSYVNAVSRLTAARFNAKTAETELLRIQGGLIQ